ncbi:hypothetical protein [Streptomyces phaeochromogenes]|uniref:hypothetical protein n=1 Tax=Streptomyces phaeochromogenes TaxID=1923 RepID=UPI0037132F05
MLPEALTALAEAGGSAVVTAAGTTAWEGLRGQLARWFGRGDAEREREELELLERSAAELAAASDEEVDRVRGRQLNIWHSRINNRLEELADEEERARAAAELRQLLRQAPQQAPDGAGLVAGNTFYGPTAVQAGDNNQQDVTFGHES